MPGNDKEIQVVLLGKSASELQSPCNISGIVFLMLGRSICFNSAAITDFKRRSAKNLRPACPSLSLFPQKNTTYLETQTLFCASKVIYGVIVQGT